MVSEYKELANTMKNTSSISSEYSEAEKRIKSVEDQLIEAYPELNDLLKQNTKAKWENVEAIQEMTDKELEAAKAQAWVSLDNNKVNNYSDIAEDIAKYQELIDKRREYADLLSQGKKKTIGSNVEIVDMAVEQSKGWKNEIIMITHGDCLKDAEYVAGRVREKMGIENILINNIGTVIGSHTGPGVVAVFCMGNER